MIGRLTGILLEKQPPQMLIDVSGVAYEVEASMQTFYRLPELNNKVVLHTHLIVRDDAHLLYGFYEIEERSLFRSLIKVNGVGPKLALTILSSMDPNEFVRCIVEHDSMKLTRMPGVGKKTAERLIIEMQDRLKSWGKITESGVELTLFSESTAMNKAPEYDAINALIALGYKPQEASKAVNRVDIKGMALEEIIRMALRGMAD